jgi:DNA-binding response OmpR family regulator
VHVLVVEYDAIVLNLMLPGIGGFEGAQRLRESGNKTPPSKAEGSGRLLKQS